MSIASNIPAEILQSSYICETLCLHLFIDIIYSYPADGASN